MAAERCSICDFPIDESNIEQALAVAPFEILRETATFYHLDCALSDGSFITEDEVTEEDRQHGVYWIEKA